MSDRVERYHAAVVLAQIILEGAQADDELSIAQALNDVRDEVTAGRKNLADIPHLSTAMFERLADPKPRLHSVRVEPREAS